MVKAVIVPFSMFCPEDIIVEKIVTALFYKNRIVCVKNIIVHQIFSFVKPQIIIFSIVLANIIPDNIACVRFFR